MGKKEQYPAWQYFLAGGIALTIALLYLVQGLTTPLAWVLLVVGIGFGIVGVMKMQRGKTIASDES